MVDKMDRPRLTFQPFNFKTFNELILRKDGHSKHSIPEGGSITHRGEAQGEIKFFSDAHNW